MLKKQKKVHKNCCIIINIKERMKKGGKSHTGRDAASMKGEEYPF